MKKLPVLLLSAVGTVFAQTAPPPYLLPNLPPSLSQKVLISGSKLCPSGNPPCSQFAGAKWIFAAKGGSGGIRYDASGDLLFGTNNDATPATLLSIEKMAPDGTVNLMLNLGQQTTSCIQTSQTSLTSFIPDIDTTFSINPISNALYMVTVNRAVDFVWDPNTTTGMCVGNTYSIIGPSTIADNVYTYATIVVTGPGI